MLRSAARSLLLRVAQARPTPAPLCRLLSAEAAASPDTLSGSEKAGEEALGAPPPPPHRPPPPVTPAEAGFPFIFDLTGRGADPDYFRNAHLSDKVKEEMYAAHVADPEAASVDALAAKYRVRPQRVAAILTLQSFEAQLASSGEPLYTEFARVVEMNCGATACGTGEAIVPINISYPSFEVVPLGAPEHTAVSDARDAAATPEGMAKAAAELEAEHFAEFSERLARNVFSAARAGSGRSRKTGAPRRPKEGWALVVTPLGGGTTGIDAHEQAYVAAPGGARRPPSAAEADELRKKRVKPRRKLT